MDFSYRSELLSLTHQRIPRNNMARCHAHDNYELYFLMEGERYLFAGDRFYTVRAGDIFLIPPKVEHRTLDSGGGEYERIAANISPCLGRGLPSEGVHFVRPCEKNGEKLYLEAREIVAAEGMKAAEQGVALCAAVMKMLSILLSEPSCTEEATVASPALGRVAEILKYMEEHFFERLTLTGLSERFFISEFYLCRLFKEYTGRTIFEYLTDLRVKKAEKMLATTGERITAVSEKCGFGSVSSFGSAFRRATGFSPRDYRNKTGNQ